MAEMDHYEATARGRVAALGTVAFDAAQRCANEAALYDGALEAMWDDIAVAITHAQTYQSAGSGS